MIDGIEFDKSGRADVLAERPYRHSNRLLINWIVLSSTRTLPYNLLKDWMEIGRMRELLVRRALGR